MKTISARIPGMANMCPLVYDAAVPTTPRFVALIAIVSAVACGPTIPKYDYSKEPDPRKQEYAIGASDMLDINVWNQEKLNREVRVRPDGTITLALLGDIQAA